MRLLLIRHGRTELAGRYCGSGSDPPLSEQGVKEAKELKKALPFIPDTVFSSDMLRASQTAELLFGKGNIIYTPLLRELHFGEWEGKSHEELETNDEYQRWLKEPFKRSPPQGEDFIPFLRRVKESIEILKSTKGTKVGVVSHAGILKAIIAILEGQKVEEVFFNMTIGYADYRTYEVDF